MEESDVTIFICMPVGAHYHHYANSWSEPIISIWTKSSVSRQAGWNCHAHHCKRAVPYRKRGTDKRISLLITHSWKQICSAETFRSTGGEAFRVGFPAKHQLGSYKQYLIWGLCIIHAVVAVGRKTDLGKGYSCGGRMAQRPEMASEALNQISVK